MQEPETNPLYGDAGGKDPELCERLKFMAAEQWTFSRLSAYVREHAEETGHPGLARCSKSTAKRILDDAGVGLGRRIYLWFGEVNRVPVVHRWRYRMEEIDASEKPKISLAY